MEKIGLLTILPVSLLVMGLYGLNECDALDIRHLAIPSKELAPEMYAEHMAPIPPDCHDSVVFHSYLVLFSIPGFILSTLFTVLWLRYGHRMFEVLEGKRGDTPQEKKGIAQKTARNCGLTAGFLAVMFLIVAAAMHATEHEDCDALREEFEADPYVDTRWADTCDNWSGKGDSPWTGALVLGIMMAGISAVCLWMWRQPEYIE